jgi:hypothetical protein
MTFSEIGKELGFSHTMAERITRKALEKVYKRVINNGITEKKIRLSPFEALVTIARTFDLDTSSPKDLDVLYHSFPTPIKEEIKQDAIRHRKEGFIHYTL